MNLYKVISVHYAPKDFHAAIDDFVIARSDEEVLKHLKKHELSQIPETCEEYELDIDKVWKQILEDKGELEFQEEVDGYTDLFYGRTFYRWELVKSGLSYPEIGFSLNLLKAKSV